MDITWLGHSVVRMRTRNAVVIMDPSDKSGANMRRPDGDVVTISHDHPHHNFASGVNGDFLVLDGPGEYEVGGVIIEGLRSSLRPNPEAEEADALALRSTTFIFESEELRLAHLGGLGVLPTADQLRNAEHLNGLDILFLPIGCQQTLPAKDAARAARMLEPRMVIPLAYTTPRRGMAEELKVFCDELGRAPEEPISRATLNRRNVGGDELRVLLLESRS